MRVAVSAIVGTLGGPAVYASELIAAMSALASEVELVVLTDRPGVFSDVAETLELPLSSAWEQPLWDQWRVPRALRGLGAELYHGTKGVLPRWVQTPAVVTVHDLAVYRLPATFSFAQRWHQYLETPSTLRRADRVIAVSGATANDLASLFPNVKPRTVVVHNGLPTRGGLEPDAALVNSWRRTHSGGGPVLGYLGTIQPRKNIDRLVEAFRTVAGPDWSLVLAGRLRPGYRPQFLSLADSRIRYLGPIDDAEASLLLRGVDLMVSPSSYEGFGLTLLESMAAGTAVVSVAASAVPEVVGDAAALVPPDDTAALADAIQALANDPTARADLAARGIVRASMFSWSKAARETVDVYRKVLAEVAAGGSI